MSDADGKAKRKPGSRRRHRWRRSDPPDRLPFINMSMCGPPNLADRAGASPPPGASTSIGHYVPHQQPLNSTATRQGCFLGTSGLRPRFTEPPRAATATVPLWTEPDSKPLAGPPPPKRPKSVPVPSGLLSPMSRVAASLRLQEASMLRQLARQANAPVSPTLPPSTRPSPTVATMGGVHSPKSNSTRVGLRKQREAELRRAREASPPPPPDPADLRRIAERLGTKAEAAEKRRRLANRRALRGLWQLRTPAGPVLGPGRHTADDNAPMLFGDDAEPPPRQPMPELPQDLLPLPSDEVRVGVAALVAPQSYMPHWRFAWATVTKVEAEHITVTWRDPPPKWGFATATRISRDWWDDPDGGQASTSARELLRAKAEAYAAGDATRLDLEMCPPEPEDFAVLIQVLSDGRGCDMLDLGDAVIPQRSVSPLCRALEIGGGCEQIHIEQPPVNSAATCTRLDEAALKGLRRVHRLSRHRALSMDPVSPKEQRKAAAVEGNVARRLLRVVENRRARDMHQEKMGRRSLWDLARALRGAAEEDHQRNLTLCYIKEGLIGVEADEEDARPVAAAAWLCVSQRHMHAAEEVWRRWLCSLEHRERADVRAECQTSWQESTLAQRCRLARGRRERSAVEVVEREGRGQLISEVLQGQKDLWERQMKGRDALQQQERERAARDEEESRRARQRLAEEEREQQWKQDRQRAEERRRNADKQQQRQTLLKEEDKFRRAWEGSGTARPGHEATARGLIDQVKHVDLALAQRRERLGGAVRNRENVLVQRPDVSLYTDTSAKVSIFFSGSEEFITVDNTIRFDCSLPPEWFAAVDQADQLVDKERAEFNRYRAQSKSLLTPLLVNAKSQADGLGMQMSWLQNTFAEVNDTGEEGAHRPSPDELLAAKLRLYGGEIRCTIQDVVPEETRTAIDSFPVEPKTYDVLRFDTTYVTVRHGDSGASRGVSDVSVMLPKDGSEDVRVVAEVLSGLKYKCTQTEHLQAYERRIKVEVVVLVSDDPANLTRGRPRRLAQLTCSTLLTLVVHPRYLCLSGRNPFFVSYEFEEGQDDKVLLPGAVQVGDPALVVRGEDGLCSVLSGSDRDAESSSFGGSELCVNVQEGYTVDDQVYIKRVDAGPGVGVWMVGTEVIVNGTTIGEVKQGTFRKYLPVHSETHKISAAARDMFETFPQDFGDDFPGKQQTIVFNAYAQADSVHAVLDTLRFTNLSADPSEGRRIVVLSLREASQGHSTHITARVTLRGEDDATIFSVADRRTLFHAVLSPDMPEHFQRRVEPGWRRLCPDALVDDVDTQWFTGGHLKASIVGGAKPGDSLFFDVTTAVDMSEAPWHYPPLCEAPEFVPSSFEQSEREERRVPSPRRSLRCSTPCAPSPSVVDRIAALAAGHPSSHQGLALYRLPQEEEEDDEEVHYRAQVWYDGDMVGIATFKMLTVAEVYRQMEEAKEDTSSLGQTLGQPLMGRFKAAMPKQKQLGPSPGRIKEIPFGFAEVTVNFAALPHGFSTVSAAQELVRTLSFRNSLLSPREGARSVDLELLVGKTIKRELRPGEPPRLRVDTKSANDVLRERVQLRVTQALLRVPPKHTEFVYVEGSGAKRVAPFEVMPDEEVWVDTYNGGFIHVRCVEGCTKDDVFIVRADDKEGDALTVVPSKTPDADQVPLVLLRRLLPLGRDLVESLRTPEERAAEKERDRCSALRRLSRVSIGRPGLGLMALMGSAGLPDEEEEEDAGAGGREEAGSKEGEDGAKKEQEEDGDGDDDGDGDYEDDFVPAAPEQEPAADDGEAPGELWSEMPGSNVEALSAVLGRHLPHEEAQGAIARRLHLMHGHGTESTRASVDAGGLEIVRGEQPIGVAALARGECLVCFGNVQPPVRRKEVLQVLRNITYQNRSSNPQALTKVFRFSVCDGSSQTLSCAYVACEIQPVNDPTKLLLENDRWRYRQLASMSDETLVNGQLLNREQLLESRPGEAPTLAHVLCPVGQACLYDPDTAFFDKASLKVELVAGGGKHDVLGFLTEKQQLRQIEAYNARASAEGLPLMQTATISLGERRQVEAEGGVSWEQPLLVQGVGEIGQLSKPKNAAVQGVNDIQINLCRGPLGQRITIGIFTYLLNCITYSNTHLQSPPDRAAQGTRTYRARVSDGVSKEDGKTMIYVDFSLPIIQVPGMACTATVVLNASPVALVAKGLCNLPDKFLLATGFLEVLFLSGYCPETDTLVLCIPRNSQYHVRDGCLYNGQELFGKLTQTSSTIRFDFTQACRCTDRKRLQEVLRMLSITCSTSDKPPDDAAAMPVVVSPRTGDQTEGQAPTSPQQRPPSSDAPRSSPLQPISGLDDALSARSFGAADLGQSMLAEAPQSTPGTIGTRQLCVRCSEGTVDQDGHLEANVIRVHVRVDKARVTDRHGRQVTTPPPPGGAAAAELQSPLAKQVAK